MSNSNNENTKNYPNFSNPLRPFHCGQDNLKGHNCKDCDFSTDLFVLLRHHYKKIHLEKDSSALEYNLTSYICRTCTFETYSPLQWLKHYTKSGCFNTEIVQKWHKCDQCLFKTKSEEKLQSHCKNKHIQLFQCPTCLWKTKYKRHFIRHVIRQHDKTPDVKQLEKRYKCQECPYQTNNEKYLKGHMYRNHKYLLDFENAKWYKCDRCSFETQWRRCLKPHFKNMHAPENEIQWHNCPHCSYKTKYKYAIKGHVKRKHGPSSQKLYKCDECSFDTKRYEFLTKHKKTEHRNSEESESGHSKAKNIFVFKSHPNIERINEDKNNGKVKSILDPQSQANTEGQFVVDMQKRYSNIILNAISVIKNKHKYVK